MPAYLVNSGVKREIGDDYFDLLWDSVSEEDEVSTSASSSDSEIVKKEMVIGENRIMDITILSPTMKIISRSIIWKN